MSRTTHLLTIDPQRSFCANVPLADQQKIHDGELCVTGAWDDMTRVANMINRLGSKIDTISVTMDSHHLMHVAHPIWWKDAKGNRPQPFTLIREENNKLIGYMYDANGSPYDVGQFTTFYPDVFPRTLEYIKALAANKRYPHCIWPPHCLIGTLGFTIVPMLNEALLKWSETNFRTINYVSKGSNPFVEHFSAVQAEVPDPSDPSTQLNADFIQAVMEDDEILLCGEAGSHCLANTVFDMASGFKDDSFIKKCVLLSDGTSPVPGFENFQTKFINDMTARGMKVTTTVDYLA
jgi:nicotinamidase-related amidase